MIVQTYVSGVECIVIHLIELAAAWQNTEPVSHAKCIYIFFSKLQLASNCYTAVYHHENTPI